MINKKNSNIINQETVKIFTNEKESKISNNLVFTGVFVSISSILLLIFVITEKVFNFK
mgnify:FL=1|tara:strand:+ start:4367 stop:4540 length:174 start_codon:yes stop_codon:yes gene_type:complete